MNFYLRWIRCSHPSEHSAGTLVTMAGSLTIPVAEASGQTAPLGGPPIRPTRGPPTRSGCPPARAVEAGGQTAPTCGPTALVAEIGGLTATPTAPVLTTAPRMNPVTLALTSAPHVAPTTPVSTFTPHVAPMTPPAASSAVPALPLPIEPVPTFCRLVRYPSPLWSIRIQCGPVGPSTFDNTSSTLPPLSLSSQNYFGLPLSILIGGWI
jgi:hypothetical protein